MRRQRVRGRPRRRRSSGGRPWRMRRIRMAGSFRPREESNPGAEPPRSRLDCREPRLSHEFATPLNAILGNVELMLDGSTGPLSQQARDCLADVQAAGQDLLRQSRVLLLLIQALECPAPVGEQRIALEDLFGAALDEAHAGAEQLTVSGRHRAAALVGDPFWLKALARCIVELYLSAGRTGPLRIMIEQPPVLSIAWPGLDLAVVPASARALICRIIEMHGGRMHLPIDHTLDLSWAASRLCTPPKTTPGAD
ncbi:MAG TPA: histidine kinase dimerization/phospho-acceptor domain-containing protein [Geminicoccaceae bacterium]